MNENKLEIAQQLDNLEAEAYGWSINEEVLGMDCSDFETQFVLGFCSYERI